MIIVKANDQLLKNYAAQYKGVCAKLEIDPVMPLLVAYGLFSPRDPSRFNAGGNQWLRRKMGQQYHSLELADSRSGRSEFL